MLKLGKEIFLWEKHMMMFVLALDFYFQFQIALTFVFNSLQKLF